MIIDVTQRFLDNRHRRRYKIIWHYTASSTAASAMNWLDMRLDGEGTVGYHFIIDKDGTIYMLVDPRYGFMNHSGLGYRFDTGTISIALTMKDNNDIMTPELVKAASFLKEHLETEFHIIGHDHHANINHKKQDFSAAVWNKFRTEIAI